MSVFEETGNPWEQLREHIEDNDAEQVLTYLGSMTSMDKAWTISRLRPENQVRLFSMIKSTDSAEIIEDVPDAQAIGILELLPPEQAAAILEELDSDLTADLLGGLDEEDSRVIIDAMSHEEATEARQFLEYDPETAGGLMVSEVLVFSAGQTVQDVLDDLQRNREEYADYQVQYLYVTNDAGKLAGVLRMRDLLFPRRTLQLKELMISNPHKVSVDATLEDLHNFFEEHHLFGAPVVAADQRVVGVVLPEAVEEAKRKRSVHQFLGFSGIIGGEELRSMPLLHRSGRRLSWLSLNIVLNIIAASVIALHQDTLAAAIALAVFLPIVSDMSGCSGNQAVAVSLRELALDQIRPNEMARVLGKEAGVGVINGLVLGLLLGSVAWLWQGNPFLGVVVGGALALNTFVAVSFGGLVPLLIKRLKLDPALVSSPLLTTVTDMCGFFFVLSFASVMLDRL